MGLIMRYVLERDYEMELDFTDVVPIRVGTEELDFCFTDLNRRREEEQNDKNNGTIRSTVDSPMWMLEEGGLFSQDEWKPFYAVLTNIGMFRFDIQKPMVDIPRVMKLSSLKFEKMTN